MLKKQLTIVALLVIVLVVSGCVSRSQTKNDQSSTNRLVPTGSGGQEEKQENNSSSTVGAVIPDVINYLPKGEIDTSDWKIYRSEYYKMEMKYPPFLSVNDKGEEFSFSYENNWNYHYYFNKQTLSDLNGDIIEIEARRKHVGDFKNHVNYKNEKILVFEENKVIGGFAFFMISPTKGGYNPSIILMGKDVTLSGQVEIYSEKPKLEDQDPKYIDIFKAMARTVRFYE